MPNLKILLPIILLITSACTSTIVDEQRTGESAEPSSLPESLTDLPPKAVLDAQRWLGEQRDVAVEQVAIEEVEQVRWPDACLGLGQADEICAQMTIPGWRVIFQINGQEYEVRTDETGSTVRLADG